MFALGVRSDFQSRALGPLIYADGAERLRNHSRIQRIEGSWILATNTAMNSAIEGMGGERYKTWRMYGRKALPA